MYRRRKRKSGIVLFAICLCFVGLLTSAVLLFREYQTYKVGENYYAALIHRTTKKNNVDITEREGYPEIDIDIDFDELQAINPEIIGWIYGPDTVIDYPITQTTDNSYYLTHLFDRSYSRLGTIFLDYRNDTGFTDHNSILYGHHMQSGRMFASIDNYKNQDYYEDHKLLYLYTPDHVYKIEAFAGGIIDGDTGGFTTNYNTSGEFLLYLNEIRANSTFTSDVEVTKDDNIITLCTCTYTFSNARYALYGKLVKLT